MQWEIGVASTFTTEGLARFRTFSREGFDDVACTYVFAPFDQISRACREPQAVFEGKFLAAILILWRIEDLADSMYRIANGDYSRIADGVLGKLRVMASDVEALAKNYDGTVVLALPPAPRMPGLSVGLPYPAPEVDEMFVAAREIIRKVAAASPTVRLLDLDALVRETGAAATYDDRKWYLYRQPFSDKFLRGMAMHAHRLIAAGSVASKKCIVVDCDNTIWGGIVSEDGIGGIKLGDSYPGRVFADIQREILALKNRGIFVAIASKNDLDVVLEVFDKHNGMVLSRDDISVFEVNWGPKSDSMRRIAAKLNIGLDSLVLLDDNPAEIAEVNANADVASTMLLPAELTDAVTVIRRSMFFDNWRLTKEDMIRQKSALDEQRREELRVKATPEEYLASLGIKVNFFEVGETHLDRVTQLINKTNQFNLTTRRRTLPEVRDLQRSSDHRLFAFEVSDLFGEYGLVGVMITRQSDAIAELDTWLMSCRVLNRGIEEAVVAALSQQLRADGVSLIRGRYIPTLKNGMVSDLLEKRGFRNVDGAWELEISEEDSRLPSHLTLIVAPLSPRLQVAEQGL